MSAREIKTLIQCDFDSTIAAEDISFMLLDAFADGDWRQFLELYRERKIPVGVFSSETFGLVKADEQTMLDYILRQNKAEIRDGFGNLLEYCAKRGFKFVIVSNGLGFYIEAILKNLGVDGIEVYAAETEFDRNGLKVRYFGPDGSQLQDNFKKAYVELFHGQGYRVIYIGDGLSDRIPASQADYIFARDDLLAGCLEEKKPNCTPFNDLNDVVRGLERL
jgi:2-hydroxy-3-keto-5-methylthiopentenyl-1-phosphate phosphatase